MGFNYLVSFWVRGKMKNSDFYGYYAALIALIFAVWILLSLMASGVKTEHNNCGKNYPIDYLLATNLFCEMNEDES